jgi:hypothetical protein
MYPQIRFGATDGFVPVSNQPILMLSALTGTGKSTALSALSNTGASFDLSRLPARRDLADFIIIPTGQALVNDSIAPVTNREDRFLYTRIFAEHFDGGMASIYSALYCTACDFPLLSEGIRGAMEIAYALEHCVGWHILELTVNPVTRLRRLSSRSDSFDQANSTYDLAFLPETYHAEVTDLLNSGDISAKALTIMRAESENYGLMPYGVQHDRYHMLAVDDIAPQTVANTLVKILQRMSPDAQNP